MTWEWDWTCLTGTCIPCLISLVMCLFMQEHRMVFAFTLRWLLVPPLSPQHVTQVYSQEGRVPSSFPRNRLLQPWDLGQWAGVSVASLVLSQLPAWVVAPVTSNCSKPLQSSSVPSFKDRYNPIFSTLRGRMWTIFQLLIFFIVRRPSLLKFLFKVLLVGFQSRMHCTDTSHTYTTSTLLSIALD